MFFTLNYSVYASKPLFSTRQTLTNEPGEKHAYFFRARYSKGLGIDPKQRRRIPSIQQTISASDKKTEKKKLPWFPETPPSKSETTRPEEASAISLKQLSASTKKTFSSAVKKLSKERRLKKEVIHKEEDVPEVKFFDTSPFSEKFDIPWGSGVLIWGVVGWGAAFILTGGVIVPLLAAGLGVSLNELPQQQQSLYILGVQVAETVAGIAVINLAISKFRPLPPDLFRIDLGMPLSGPRGGWALWGTVGYLAAFPSVLATSYLCQFLSVNQDQGPGTVDAVVPLLDSSDPIGLISLLIVTSVLAPLVEEYVFRGFVLTSLTKWVPTPLAVVGSSALFAGAHFAPKDFPQLFALGIILGFSYLRTRNLMTPIMVHALWNSIVLVVFIFLQSQGIDITDYIATAVDS